MSTEIIPRTTERFNIEVSAGAVHSGHAHCWNTASDSGSAGGLGLHTSIHYPPPSALEVGGLNTSTATITLRGESTGIDTLSGAAMHKRNRYRLQRVAANILGAEWRVGNCMWTMREGDYDGVAGGVTVQRTVTDEGCGRHYYGGLMTCGSVWTCPVCAAKIAAERAEELRQAIDAHAANGGAVVMVTTTIQHRRSDKLTDLLDAHKTALQHQRTGAAHRRFVERFGLVGHARSVEIRVSHDTGFHPHTHEILFLDKAPDVSGIHVAYNSRYGAKLRESGYHVNEHTVAVTADRGKISDYLTKFALELTAGHDKESHGDSYSPFQLLDLYATTGRRWYADKFREYAEATKGRNWFNWSRVTVDGKQVSLYEFLTGNAAAADDDIAESEGDGEGQTQVTLTLTRDEWRRLCVKQLRASALLHADADAEGLRDWLIAEGVIIADGDNAEWRAARAREYVLSRIGRPVAFDDAAELRRAVDIADLGDSVQIVRVPLTWGA